VTTAAALSRFVVCGTRTTVAPCSWASLATENAIDWSVMTPVMSSRLPAISPDTKPPALIDHVVVFVGAGAPVPG